MDGKQDLSRLAAWRRGASFPFAILLVFYTALIGTGIGLVRIRGEQTSSPYHTDSNWGDVLGGSLSFSGPAPVWVEALFVGMIFSVPAQQAMFVAWAVFTSGKWQLRLAAALTAAMILYAMLALSFSSLWESLLIGDWQNDAAPFLLIPLALLCLAGPLAFYAVISGRRLSHREAELACAASRKQFSIATLLWGTAGFAASLALARLQKNHEGEAEVAISMLIYSAIYILPIAWCALAIRRLSISLISTLVLATLFSVPFALPTSAEMVAAKAGLAIGIVWTVPFSLFIWRWCGYRLALPCDNMPKNSN